MSASEGRDMVEILKHDHREVEAMFRGLETMRGAQAGKAKKQLVAKATIELVRHSAVEEMYLYPAARKVLPDGDGLADEEIAEHAEAERLMKDLEDMPLGTDYDAKLDKLMAAVRGHIKEEEQVLFVALSKACSPEELSDLGEKISAAKKLAPTRPHPDAPDTPPANMLAGPALGLVDRVRDAMSGRGR
jgi:hemerythrin-like domain-containing protein